MFCFDENSLSQITQFNVFPFVCLFFLTFLSSQTSLGDLFLAGLTFEVFFDTVGDFGSCLICSFCNLAAFVCFASIALSYNPFFCIMYILFLFLFTLLPLSLVLFTGGLLFLLAAASTHGFFLMWFSANICMLLNHFLYFVTNWRLWFHFNSSRFYRPRMAAHS